ncbi:MAG TPA: hypothetical protein VL147_17110 [Devosia sp.]|nr:hypothetical protein [Devosia sp.]
MKARAHDIEALLVARETLAPDKIKQFFPIEEGPEAIGLLRLHCPTLLNVRPADRVTLFTDGGKRQGLWTSSCH